MSKPLSRKYVEEYDSDDGFVEDAPKSKKHKSEPKQLKSGVQKDADGNDYWELSGKRRVQVSEFKGNTMISVREYYEKDGKTLPGKKGISMTIDQYSAFLELLPDIEQILKKKGLQVPRPPYDKASAAQDGEEDQSKEEEHEASDSEDIKTKSKHKGKLDKFKAKKNHETTSDEDED